MRRALLLAALLLPAAARARPSAALRLAFAPALGDVAESVPMSDAMRAQVPLQLDLLWRVGPLSAGAYVSWGLGQGGPCDAGASCSASDLRVGVEGLHAFAPLGRAGVVPWAGLGLGWQWTSRSRERLGNETTFTWSGAELSLQGGAEWPLAGRYSLGPFVSIALGRYGRVALDTPEGSASAEIGSKAIHAFIHVGVRGKVDL